MIEQLKQTYEVGLKTRDYLETGRFKDFAELMTEHWRRKVSVMPSVSNERINALFELALRSGAVGGKLIGAGGGGFLLLYASDLEKLIYEMEKNGATYTPFSFDFEGTRLV